MNMKAAGQILAFCMAVLAALFAPSSASAKGGEPDVYVVGYQDKNNIDVACYWKNGKRVDLTDGSINAWGKAIAVSGKDVYVAGCVGETLYNASVACYWKNGQRNDLTRGDTVASASAIAVSGNDVYVAVHENIDSGVKIGFWKNNQYTALTTGNNQAHLGGIAVSGNDVHVVFSERNRANRNENYYWKNGQKSPFASPDVFLTDIVVSGNDVYVAGSETIGSNQWRSIHKACYWKNGQRVDLTNGRDYNAGASAIAVSGNDVYVAGYDNIGVGRNNTTIYCYWKNGQQTVLSGGLFGIVVVGR
ncbi:MAG: hypothetical protein Pg6C_11870 [Treponemataceae bacterium]|nr:MAG: hypothetical protein Pg6C_11870 [Treponemataceae bacterium]